MVKVFTGRDDCACISPTMVDESIPPDRKAPSGTSAIICWRTALPSSPSSWAMASMSVPFHGAATPARATPASDQYGTEAGSFWCCRSCGDRVR